MVGIVPIYRRRLGPGTGSPGSWPWVSFSKQRQLGVEELTFLRGHLWHRQRVRRWGRASRVPGRWGNASPAVLPTRAGPRHRLHVFREPSGGAFKALIAGGAPEFKSSDSGPGWSLGIRPFEEVGSGWGSREYLGATVSAPPRPRQPLEPLCSSVIWE